jgi:hypothetical protein
MTQKQDGIGNLLLEYSIINFYNYKKNITIINVEMTLYNSIKNEEIIFSDGLI